MDILLLLRDKTHTVSATNPVDHLNKLDPLLQIKNVLATNYIHIILVNDYLKIDSLDPLKI